MSQMNQLHINRIAICLADALALDRISGDELEDSLEFVIGMTVEIERLKLVDAARKRTLDRYTKQEIAEVLQCD